jgi:hypothetical protein
MVGLKVPGVCQLRRAEQVDLVRRDQGWPAPGRPLMHERAVNVTSVRIAVC